MLSRLRTLDAIDAPFALGDRVMPPPAVAAVAPKAVADWTRATMADILTDAERGALAEAFPVPKCIARPAVDMHDSAPALRFPVISKTYEVDSHGNVTASPAVASHDSAPVENRQRCRIPAAECLVPVDLSSANDPELRAVAERMAVARQQAAAAADWAGWTLHDGKGCPVPPETRVLVRMRDGYQPRFVKEAEWFAGGCGLNDWDHSDELGRQIIAYRVVPQ